jgi:hypothetical protein
MESICETTSNKTKFITKNKDYSKMPTKEWKTQKVMIQSKTCNFTTRCIILRTYNSQKMKCNY